MPKKPISFLMRIEIDKVISKKLSNQGIDLVILLK